MRSDGVMMAIHQTSSRYTDKMISVYIRLTIDITLHIHEMMLIMQIHLENAL